MMQTTKAEKVSSSMVRSVYNQLKSNGYSNGQIMGLSNQLAQMAVEVTEDAGHTPADVAGSFTSSCIEYDLSLLGYPSE